MADSVRSQIKTALMTKLGGGPATVRRSLTEALKADSSLPAIVVEWNGEAIEADAHEDQRRTLDLRVVCIVASTGEDVIPIDDLVDPLTDWVEQKVAEDETFTGADGKPLANEAYATGIVVHIEAGDQEYVGAEMNIRIIYLTKRGDPTVSAA